MNKFIFLISIFTIISCGKGSYPLLLKTEELLETKQQALVNFVRIHEHVEILNDLLDAQISDDVSIPTNVNCDDYILDPFEVDQILDQCQNAFFDVCPRGFENYKDWSLAFVRRCEELKVKK
ncbi:MAG: hypothetical protein ACN6I6_00655 [bacterium]